jgi:hypothetical protein
LAAYVQTGRSAAGWARWLRATVGSMVAGLIGDVVDREPAASRALGARHGAARRGRRRCSRCWLDLQPQAYRRSEERGEPRASCNLAILLEELGDIDGAKAAYRRADERGFSGSAYGLAQLLYAEGDIDGALAANRLAGCGGGVVDALGLDPHDAEVGRGRPHVATPIALDHLN